MANLHVVTDVDELRALLGDSFVVFFGSAISGVMEPKLPMIWDVMGTFLEQAAIRLSIGSYQDKVIAGYADSMVRGYHKALLQQTKFENFIFDLQRSVGKEKVDELFFRIFTRSGRQYNNNHSALAFLLCEGKCVAAFTTNFDNQIELCLPELRTYIFPDLPKRLPGVGDSPIYVKLHGDAATKTYVATSPQLSHARSLDTYAFIEEILRDQAVLILGYSGTGDIDIAPHLGKQERVLLWGDLNIDAAKIKPPNQIDFICDLSLDTPGTAKEQRRNLLLDLAASYGWKPPEEIEQGQMFQWKQDLIDWTGKIPLEQLRAFITSFMSWRTSWPHVHIAYQGLKERKTYMDQLEYALSTVQVAAYNSSERLLKPLLQRDPPDLKSYFLSVELFGFTLWGKRKYTQALSTYHMILRLCELLVREWKSTPDREVESMIAGVARQYLETMLEVINNEREDRKRMDLARHSEAKNVKALLAKQEQEDSNYYLNRIAILETEYWLDGNASLEELWMFFNQCMAMQEWEAAALTALFMTTLSHEEGRKAAEKILPQLGKRKSSKLIIKVKARILYERMDRRIPNQVLNFKAFTSILLIPVELFFALKRLLWNLDRRLDRIRVETGFLGLGKVLPRRYFELSNSGNVPRK